MLYRKLSDSDLFLSAITFGAWAIGGWKWGGSVADDAIKAIHASIDNGVTSIDTAPIYGQGRSEELVGKALKNISRDKVQILTKFGLRWNTTEGHFYFDSEDNDGKPIQIRKFAGKNSVIYEVEQSLKRLGTDYIDLYQIHWHDPSTPIEESFEAVSRLLEQGKIRYAGVCNYTAEQMEKADAVAGIVSNQVPFSMVGRDILDDLVPHCIKKNKSILAYSPLERGLLTGKITPDYEFNEGDHRAEHPSFSKASIIRTNEFLEKIKPIADEKSATLAQLVLRWTIDVPGITIALAGARNSGQASQNAKAADLKLSKEEFDYIDGLVKEML